MRHRRWFEDDDLGASLPLGFRALARYFRAADAAFGRAVGGSFLCRRLCRLRALAGMPEASTVRVAGRSAHVLLTDPAVLRAFNELVAPGPEHELVRRLLGPGDSFVDVGANHGVFCHVAHDVVGAHGGVWAVEPNPALAEALRASFVLMGRDPGRVLEFAAADRAGAVELFVPEDDTGTGGLFAPHSATGRFGRLQVRQATLDQDLPWRDLPGRIMAKLDVEGAEVRAVRGAREFLTTRRPALLLEVNAGALGAAGESVAALVRALEEVGYTTFAEVDALDRRLPSSNLAPDSSRNIVAFNEA